VVRVWRKTAKKRMVAKLRAIKAELRLRMHEPVADVGAWLQKVVNGYYRYHAVPGNIDRLSIFGQRLRRLWCSFSAAAVSDLCRGIGSYRSSHGGFHYFRKTSPGRVEMRIRRKTNRITPNRSFAWLR